MSTSSSKHVWTFFVLACCVCFFAHAADPQPAEKETSSPIAQSKGGDPGQPAPPPASPVNIAASMQSIYAQAEDFEFRSISEAYAKSKFRDPKWDDKVTELFHLGAAAYAAGPCAPKPEKIIKLSYEILKLGCKDPMVDAIRTQFAPRGLVTPSYLGIVPLQRALEEAGYPPHRRWRLVASTIDELCGLKVRPPSLASRAEDDPDRCEQLLRETFLAIKGNRLLESYFFSKFEDDEPEVMTRDFTKHVAEWPLEESVRHILCATWHFREAWRLRGHGFSSVVTDAGQAGFSEHLGLAREFLRLAYKLDPTRPEASVLMLNIVASESADGDETEDIWFDRAVKAQFDFKEAYSARLHYLLPRWGGSYEAMYAFAQRCLETNRFDTAVPAQMMTAIADICEDAKNFRTSVEDDSVYKVVCRLRDGYLAADPKIAAPEMRTAAVYFWQRGDYASALKICDALGDCAPWDRKRVFGTREDEFDTLFAYASPAGPKLLESRSASETGDIEKVTALNAEAKQATLNSDFFTKQRVARLCEQFRFRAEFERGDRVSLCDSEGRNTIFMPLYFPNKPRLAKGEAISLLSSPNGEQILEVPVGRRFNAKATINLPPLASSPDAGAGFGLFVDTQADESANGMYVRVLPGAKGWQISQGWNKDSLQPITIRDSKFSLEVICWDGLVVIKIDGDTVYAKPMPVPQRTLGDRFSLVVSDRVIDKTLIDFHNLWIRRLKQPPAEIEELLKANPGNAVPPAGPS